MEELNVFDKLTAIATPAQLTMFGDSERSRAIAEHKAWLQSIRHERPNTESNYKIGIYIRYSLIRQNTKIIYHTIKNNLTTPSPFVRNGNLSIFI